MITRPFRAPSRQPEQGNLAASKAMTPWNFAETSLAPDRRIALRYVSLGEFGVGTPLAGGLRLDPPGFDFGTRRFGGPPVWSEDGRYAAIPEWTGTWGQQLTVFDLRHLEEASTGGAFRVLQLGSIVDGRVTGVDSPIHGPSPVAVPIDSLPWTPLASRRMPVASDVPLRKRLAWRSVQALWLCLWLAPMLVALPFVLLYRWVRSLLARDHR